MNASRLVIAGKNTGPAASSPAPVSSLGYGPCANGASTIAATKAVAAA